MTSPLPTDSCPGLVILPGTVSGPAEGDSGQPTRTDELLDEHDAEEVGVGGLFPYWPDTERSSSTSSASSPKSTQNKRTLAFWLGQNSTTVARGALRVLRALVVEPTDPCRYRGIVGDVWAGTSRAS